MKKEIHFENCTLVFQYEKPVIDGYSDLHIFIQRPGKIDIKFEKEDFVEILNALIDCRFTVNSTDTVYLQHKKIDAQFDHNGNSELFLVSTKINDDIKITLLGFENDTLNPPIKKFSIHFQPDDDIFNLCGTFLKFLSDTSEFHATIAVM
jgi:hypothetical protein